MNENERQPGEDDVMALARGLATDVEPERDLWPGIATAIDTQAGRRDNAPHGPPAWRRMFAQAAAVVLLVGASSGLTWLALKDNAVQPVPAGGSAPLTFEPVSGSFGSQYTLGPDFQDARLSLVERLDDELERLPEETRAEVVKNVEAIRAAIAEINRALAEEPDNALLQQLLISAYGEEIAIMRKVDDIAGSAMRRTDI